MKTQEMINYAKRVRRATGDYCAVQLHISAHTSGSEDVEYSVYTPASGHTYFDTEDKMRSWLRQELQMLEAEKEAT